MTTASTFPALLQRFFTERLGAQMQASANTVAGYRDTFRLLLRFAGEQRRKPPTRLKVEDIDADWFCPECGVGKEDFKPL